MNHKVTAEEKAWLENEYFPTYWHLWEVGNHLGVKKQWVDVNVLDRFREHFGYNSEDYSCTNFCDPVYRQFTNASARVHCGERPAPPCPANMGASSVLPGTSLTPVPAPLMSTSLTPTPAPSAPTPQPLPPSTMPSTLIPTPSASTPQPLPLSTTVSHTTSSQPSQEASSSSGSLLQATWASNEWRKDNAKSIMDEQCRLGASCERGSTLNTWRKAKDTLWRSVSDEDKRLYEEKASIINKN
uniref:Uncharacterized protein n=1 Tax=Moniliophthora roreri TaxID=221103 RepID=A0A0W0FE85_MONRR